MLFQCLVGFVVTIFNIYFSFYTVSLSRFSVCCVLFINVHQTLVYRSLIIAWVFLASSFASTTFQSSSYLERYSRTNKLLSMLHFSLFYVILFLHQFYFLLRLQPFFHSLNVCMYRWILNNKSCSIIISCFNYMLISGFFLFCFVGRFFMFFTLSVLVSLFHLRGRGEEEQCEKYLRILFCLWAAWNACISSSTSFNNSSSTKYNFI